MVHGLTRKGMRWIKPAVKKEEVKNREKKLEVRGTMKDAVLRVDKVCPNLVESSVYDNKPVHLLSMLFQQLKWIVKDKPLFNVDTSRVESLRFLRMNTINDYNNNMGHVDISDQLQNTHRFDHLLRNRKWWWLLLFWALGIMLVNAYVIYTIVNITEVIPKNISYLIIVTTKQ